MSVRTDKSSVSALFWTNHEVTDIPEMEGEDGGVDVERTDPYEVAIHFRHWGESDNAMISAYLTREQASFLAAMLLARAAA